MTTQEKEWREKIYNLVKEVHIQKPFEDVTGEPHYVTDEIMKLLDQHSAHLVERISEKKIPPFVAVSHEDALNIEGYNKALDQAIDIIKDNK